MAAFWAENLDTLSCLALVQQSKVEDDIFGQF